MKPNIKLKASAVEEAMRLNASAIGPMRGGQAYNASSTLNSDLRNWQPWPGSPDSDLLPELPIIRARSRDLARNHGVAAGALQTQLDNVLGCGLWLSPTPDYAVLGKTIEWSMEWRRKVKSLWRAWAETAWCDAGRSLTLDGLATQVFSGAWLNGDGIALPLWLPDPLAPAATRIQVIESDRLSNPFYAMDTATRRGGIDIDAYGAPVSYWIRKSHPGDTYFYTYGADMTWEQIPAMTGWGRKRVIHAHDKARAGQSRGIPALAGTMHEFKVLKDYRTAELKSAVVNAMVGLVVESAMSQEQLMELLSTDNDALKNYVDGLNSRKRSAIDFGGGGMILPIPLGDKVHGFTPSRPSAAYDSFTTTAFRHIATGLNMPYELLLKDFSKTNYSSARAALLEAWRFFNGRRDWLGQSFYQPVYELWFEEMVDAGKIEAPGFYDNRTAWTRARWIGPGRGWVDPLKEAQAAELRMDIMVSTIEDECAEQGKDWEEVLEQRSVELKRLKALGLDQILVNKGLQPKGATDTGEKTPIEDQNGAPGGAGASNSAYLKSVEAMAASSVELARAVTSQAQRPIELNVTLPEQIHHNHITVNKGGGKVTFEEDAHGNVVGATIDA